MKKLFALTIICLLICGISCFAEDGDVRNTITTDEGVLTLYAPTPEMHNMYIFDGELAYYSHAGERLRLPVDSAYNIAIGSGGELIIVNHSLEGFSVSGVDLKTGARTIIMEEYATAAISLPDGGYLYTTDTDLLYMDKAGYSREIMDIAASELSPPIIKIENNTLYITDESGLRSFDIDALLVSQKSETELTIYNCIGSSDFRMTSAIGKFEAKTGIPVKMAEMDWRQMLTSLIAGESGIDILFVDSARFRQFHEANVLVALNNYPELQKNLDLWINVLGAATLDGELTAVPEYVHVSAIFVDSSLAQFFGADLPEECTWLELFEMANKFQNDTDNDGYIDAYYFKDNMYYPEFIRQYISAYANDNIDFSDEYFIKMLEMYKELIQSGYVGDEFNPAHTMGCLFRTFGMDGVRTSLRINFPTLEDGAPYVIGNFQGMGVNAFSQNIDLAIEFFSIYAAPDNQAYPEGFGYARDLSLNAEYAKLTEAEKEKLTDSIKDMELAAPLWQNDDFTKYLRENMMLYIDNEIDVYALVDRLNQKMRMVKQG